MIKALFAAKPERWAEYETPLKTAFADAGLTVDLAIEANPNSVDYIIYAPNSGLTDFAPFTRTKAVLNLWAGVEDVVGNPTLTQPLARMVDPGLTEGMVEWVCGHTLRYHLDLEIDINRKAPVWQPRTQPLARDRKVTVLGLGALGQACARALVGLNFRVSGWSKSAKSVSGITCFHGDAGLVDALHDAEILILLLPLTPETESLINTDRLNQLPKGARLINPGRGALIDDDDLLEALASGHIGHATLDVFRTEPLPPAHAFWAHPQITVTPHIAAETRPSTAARVIAENIRRGEAGQPFLHLVDRTAGY